MADAVQAEARAGTVLEGLRPTRAVLQLFELELLAEGDHVMITSGDHMEHHGATNTLRLLTVGSGGRAEGLGEL